MHRSEHAAFHAILDDRKEGAGHADEGKQRVAIEVGASLRDFAQHDRGERGSWATPSPRRSPPTATRSSSSLAMPGGVATIRARRGWSRGRRTEPPGRGPPKSTAPARSSTSRASPSPRDAGRPPKNAGF